ncbi:hypothetical protein ACLOJK_019754 [Asimina triloba]
MAPSFISFRHALLVTITTDPKDPTMAIKASSGDAHHRTHPRSGDQQERPRLQIAFSSVHPSGSKGTTTRTGGPPDQRSSDLHGALRKRRPPFDQPPGQQRNPSSTQQQIPKSSIDGSGSSTHLELDSKRTSTASEPRPNQHPVRST